MLELLHPNRTVLVPAMPTDHWSELAACKGHSDIFFYSDYLNSGRYAKSGNPYTDEAITICNTCVVRPSCLEYALDNNIQFLVWGGMTTAERQRIRRHRSLVDSPPDAMFG